MRIGWTVRVEDLPGGGVSVVARDWPLALPTAALLALPGVPLLAWGLAFGHWIEAGGGGVFSAMAAGCVGLALSGRRRLRIVPWDGSGDGGGKGVTVTGVEGAGPFRRKVSHRLGGTPRFEVVPFPTPDGAPDLADRGGDLVLREGDFVCRIARRAGAGWRELESARGRMETAVGVPSFDRPGPSLGSVDAVTG